MALGALLISLPLLVAACPWWEFFWHPRG